MKITVLQRSSISRYAGEFPSLSAFRLCPAPAVADREQSEESGQGELSVRDEGVFLTYTEEQTRIPVALALTGDTLTITRGGAELSFRAGGVTAFSYRAVYGTLPMEAYTEQISFKEREGTMLLTLVYYAVLGDMAQKNEMRFKITKA